MPTTAEILDSIQIRLRDLNAEIEKLTAARAALARSGDPRRVGERPTAIVAPNGRAAQAKRANGEAQKADATPSESRRASASSRPRAGGRSGGGTRGRKRGRSVEVAATGKLELL